jgi:transposase
VDLVVRTVFSGLAALTINEIEDAGEVIVVRASTRGGAVACPACGTLTWRVHALHERVPADVPVGGRRVLVRVRVRRMRCQVRGCARQTFREQVPGVLERYQRRTVRLSEQLRSVVRELAGRASARLLPVVGIAAGKDTAVRALLGIALPDRPVPRVLGIDDFALRRSRQYATVLIDADTGQRIDVLAGRGFRVVADWLRAHPGVEVVCRDGSTTYAQAVREALPGAVQVADRWHLWHGLAEASLKEVAAHSVCWAGATGLQDGPRAATTIERWQQVHQLLDQGVGLLDCSRRLNLGLNTVKRYARARQPGRLHRVPQYRPTLVDPYRDHLRRRRAEEPGVPVTRLLDEIRELGYPGSANLLQRYLNQGRADEDRAHLSPRRATRLLLTRPDKLSDRQRERRDKLAAACPEITALRDLIAAFAALLKPDKANVSRLDEWIRAARNADLPHLHSFLRGIEQDREAVVAALTTPHHNGRTEGVNTRTKMLKRQMYGRADFALLRHRILLD